MSNELDLGQLLRKVQEDLQGYALDLARISAMDDRALQQFEKSVKKYFRSTIDSTNEALKEYTKFTISDRPPFDASASSRKEK
jgi:cob(I)alamin adenosyltransferase